MSLGCEPFTGDPGEWDRFIESQPGWTHFHRHGWREIYRTVFGDDCLYQCVRDPAGRLQGVLPLVRVRTALFGHYLVSLPFVNYGGPLGSPDAVRLLADDAVERARRDRVKLLELRNRGELPIDLPASHRKVTVVLELPDDPAVLFKSFEAKLRTQVRKPQKEGVTVRFGSDQVIPFYGVFARHMRDLGTPTQPLDLFQALARQFPDAWFGCAYLGEVPVAGGVGFVWNGEFEMTWASSLYAYNRVAPNMLLYWSFMERAIQQGIRRFNFGRCSPGSGTHRFKRQWGAVDEPLWWYQWSEHGVAGTPSPDDGAYSWGPRLWRRLPLGLANIIGPWIVRGIP
jgi:serine/alanine adding enzyme